MSQEILGINIKKDKILGKLNSKSIDYLLKKEEKFNKALEKLLTIINEDSGDLNNYENPIPYNISIDEQDLLTKILYDAKINIIKQGLV